MLNVDVNLHMLLAFMKNMDLLIAKTTILLSAVSSLVLDIFCMQSLIQFTAYAIFNTVPHILMPVCFSFYRPVFFCHYSSLGWIV